MGNEYVTSNREDFCRICRHGQCEIEPSSSKFSTCFSLLCFCSSYRQPRGCYTIAQFWLHLHQKLPLDTHAFDNSHSILNKPSFCCGKYLGRIIHNSKSVSCCSSCRPPRVKSDNSLYPYLYRSYLILDHRLQQAVPQRSALLLSSLLEFSCARQLR